MDLIAPDNTHTVSCINAFSQRIDTTLNLTGTYTVLISSYSFDGTYSLALEKVAPPSNDAKPIQYLDTINDEINPIGDIDLFSFYGTKNDAIILKVTSTSSIRPCMELIAPDNSKTVECGNAFSQQIDTTLNSTGIYTVLISPYSFSGTYDLNIQCIAGVCNSYPLTGQLMPLKVGQTFTYAVKDGIGNTWEQVLAVTGRTFIPSLGKGKGYFHLDRMDVGDKGPLDDPVMFNIRSTQRKVFVYDGFGVEHLAFQQAPKDTCWTYTDFEGEEKEACIVAKGITVTVPAGTFTGCLKIRTTCVACDDDYYIEWLKPGFTVVKWVDYWTDKPEPVTYMLKSWTE